MKCKHNGILIRPDGVNELDPCVYEDIAIYHNVTVIISKCKYCGEEMVSWIRQENTEEGEV